MRPRTDNSIEQGSGNTQIGHNTGEVHVGLTFEQHQQALQEALADKTADLERAHGAEKDLLRRETDELRRRLSEVETDYQDRLEELATLKADLSKFENRFEKEKFDAANAALDRDDTSLAEALFKELLTAAEARREDAEQDEAALHYRLGKIAEDAVRWHDAARHYSEAARLAPGYDTLFKARKYAWHAGHFESAHRCGTDLVAFARKEGTQEQIATALNEHALTLRAQGRNAEAEALFREGLEIGRKTIGEGHPAYATRLNNLALVVQEQGRAAEAEGLYREALEIDRKTIGEAHPGYAIHLNNLAGVVEAQGRVAEAEALYREALEITRTTIANEHPDHAIRLNNLAGVVRAQGRVDEAEGLYRQALEITRKTIGETHPDHAIRLVNLGSLLGQTDRVAEGREMLEQALAIFRAALPPDHPHVSATQRALDALPDP